MKKILLILGLIVSTLSIKSQGIEVPNNQIPLITKISASWCPHCGNWGWSFYEGLRQDNLGKAVMMTAHYSGDYRTNAGAAIASNFGIIGQPEFYLGTDKIAANSSNFSSMLPSVASNVSAVAQQSPLVQSGLKVLLQPENGTMTIKSKAKFFSATTGEYYLGLYLLETEFIGYQAGQGNSAQHKNILRAVLGENHFGDLIGLGAIEANKEVDLEHTFNLSASGFQSGNIEIVAIIWEKVGNKYQYVNANSTTTIDLVSAGKELEQVVVQFSITPNPLEKKARLSLQLKQKLNKARLQISTLDGKVLQTLLSKPSFSAGTHQFEIDRSAFKSTGMYLVQILSDEGILTRKIVVQ